MHAMSNKKTCKRIWALEEHCSHHLGCPYHLFADIEIPLFPILKNREIHRFGQDI